MEKNSFLYFLMIFPLIRAFYRRVCGDLRSDILPSLHRLAASQCKPCALCQNCLNVMYHVSSINDDSPKGLQLVHRNTFNKQFSNFREEDPNIIK